MCFGSAGGLVTQRLETADRLPRPQLSNKGEVARLRSIYCIELHDERDTTWVGEIMGAQFSQIALYSSDKGTRSFAGKQVGPNERAQVSGWEFSKAQADTADGCHCGDCTTGRGDRV
jgi:hypothetical protein